MKDIKLVEKCLICNKNLMLMTSMRADESRKIFLVKRCLNCGCHPVEEVVEIVQAELITGYYTESRLKDFINMYKFTEIYANRKTKDKIKPEYIHESCVIPTTLDFVNKYLNQIKIDNTIEDDCIKGYQSEKEYIWYINKE